MNKTLRPGIPSCNKRQYQLPRRGKGWCEWAEGRVEGLGRGCQSGIHKGLAGSHMSQARLDPASGGFLEKWIGKENGHHLRIPAGGRTVVVMSQYFRKSSQAHHPDRQSVHWDG